MPSLGSLIVTTLVKAAMKENDPVSNMVRIVRRILGDVLCNNAKNLWITSEATSSTEVTHCCIMFCC